MIWSMLDDKFDVRLIVNYAQLIEPVVSLACLVLYFKYTSKRVCI